MGIHRLASWIHWAARSTVVAPDWKQYEGKVIGIDILGFLYKWKQGKQSAPLQLAYLVAACRRANLTPVAVFDGRPPAAKTAVRNAGVTASMPTTVERAFHLPSLRTSSPLTISSAERDAVKQFLYACGVLSLNAAEEADDVLAAFAKMGHFAAVISHDYDMLARGVETLLVPKPYALPGDIEGWSAYSLSAIEHAASLTHSQFVAMCVLMGCDYSPSEMPACRAYWAAKREGDKAFFDPAQHAAAARYLATPTDLRALMGEKQWEKWRAGPPAPEPETLAGWRAAGGILTVLETQVFEDLHSRPGDGQCGSGQLDGGIERRIGAQDHPERPECQHEQNEEQNGG